MLRERTAVFLCKWLSFSPGSNPFSPGSRACNNPSPQTNTHTALSDYNQALELAAGGGESPDPYVINARGNCHNSLGQYQEARADYLAAAGAQFCTRGHLCIFAFSAACECKPRGARALHVACGFFTYSCDAGDANVPCNANTHAHTYTHVLHTHTDVFQASRGYRGRNGNTTARLDGAIFAVSLALQLDALACIHTQLLLAPRIDIFKDRIDNIAGG